MSILFKITAPKPNSQSQEAPFLPLLFIFIRNTYHQQHAICLPSVFLTRTKLHEDKNTSMSSTHSSRASLSEHFLNDLLWLRSTSSTFTAHSVPMSMLNHAAVASSLRPHGLHGLPGSSVRGIFQERILEWVAISYSKGSSWPRD